MNLFYVTFSNRKQIIIGRMLSFHNFWCIESNSVNFTCFILDMINQGLNISCQTILNN